MCHTFPNHSPVDGYIGSFHLLAIMNNATMNINMEFFVSTNDFIWVISRSGIAGLHSKFIFNLLRNCQTLF